MTAFSLSRIVALAALAGLASLAACASPPKRINNLCAVFEQNDGYFTNWRSSAKAAERKYGIPVSVLMATIRKESGFQHNARPPRKFYLGFIPGKRASSAYGFAQAINGTWDNYRNQSGNYSASRTSFDDAVDFVGWYHNQTATRFGIAPSDMTSLYLAYYSGWDAFGKGSWRSNGSLVKYARDTAKTAADYEAQMQACGE